MLTLKEHPGCFLVELTDLCRQELPAAVQRHTEPLHRIARWAAEYLCQGHPELGRDGPVCPYTEPAIKKRTFYLTVKPGRLFTAEEIQSTLLAYRDWFLELEPREGKEAFFKTILILFPDLTEAEIPELIDATQERLKPEYVRRGLMLGEFHAGPPNKAGLWNPDFRPLNSPVPMLVIRHMVPTDFGFLKDREDFVRIYLERFHDQIPPAIRQEVRQAAQSFGLSVPELVQMQAVHPHVRQVLERHGLPVKVIYHRDLAPPINGPHDVARALGYPVERITKSLFLRSTDRSLHAIVVCSANGRVDLGRVARHLGCERLDLASEEELQALLGYSPGGVCPFAADADIPVILDQGLMGFSTVLVAAGEVRVELEIDPQHLREMTGGHLLPVLHSAPGRQADHAGHRAPGKA